MASVGDPPVVFLPTALDPALRLPALSVAGWEVVLYAKDPSFGLRPCLVKLAPVFLLLVSSSPSPSSWAIRARPPFPY